MKKAVFFVLTLFVSFIGYSVNAMDQTLYNKIAANAVADNIKSTYVNSAKGIDFKYTSSDTNGKGIYTIASTLKDKYPIHYYRGKVNNNWVNYAGLCWQIVRTTENGGVKLIYSGKTDSKGTCTNELEYDEELKNLENTADELNFYYKDSAENKMIDSWYDSKLNQYSEYIDDAVYCNDITMSNNDENYTNSYFRYQEGKPTLACSKENSFTVSSKLGNGLLKYPIGEITVDEAVYAGIQNNLEKSESDFKNNDEFENYKKQIASYLSFKESYTTMTGFGIGVADDSYYGHDLYGKLSFYINDYSTSIPRGTVAEGHPFFDSLYGYVRPVITLKSNLEVKGDGTTDNPYVVSKIVTETPNIGVPETSDNIIKYFVIFGIMSTLLLGIIIKKRYE